MERGCFLGLIYEHAGCILVSNMVTALLIVLLLLLALGYIQVPALLAITTVPLITIFGYSITLMSLLVGLIILFLIGLLPSAFRTVAVVILIVWLLSLLGIVQIAGISLSNIVVIALIVLLVAYLFGRGR